MPRKRKITHDLYLKVKRQIDEDIPYRKIANLNGISFGTVGYIGRSDSYEQYFIKVRKGDIKMASGKLIDEQKYELIKTLLSMKNDDANQRDIAKVCGVSHATISRISRTTDYKDYKDLIKVQHPIDEMRIDETDDNTLIEKIYDELKKQTELLERMVEQWQS